MEPRRGVPPTRTLSHKRGGKSLLALMNLVPSARDGIIAGVFGDIDSKAKRIVLFMIFPGMDP